MVFCLECIFSQTRDRFKLRLTHYSTWITYHYITDTKQRFDGDFTEEGDTHGFELAFGRILTQSQLEF